MNSGAATALSTPQPYDTGSILGSDLSCRAAVGRPGRIEPKARHSGSQIDCSRDGRYLAFQSEEVLQESIGMIDNVR